MGRWLGRYLLSSKSCARHNHTEGIEVMMGRDMTTNRRVAVKVFDAESTLQDVEMRETVKFEIEAMMRTNGHPHVLELLEVLASPSKIFVVMETVSNSPGDLFHIVSSKGGLGDNWARHYFGQLLDAVEHCHQRGVCHRDIKPENVIVDRGRNVKLSGFALAGLFDPTMGDDVANLMHLACGTPDYTAPEVVQGVGYDGRTADVWSLGVTLYAMLAGFLPFEAGDVTELFEKTEMGSFSYAPGMIPSARSLLDKMLEPNPAERFTIRDIRSHPWFTMPREVLQRPRSRGRKSRSQLRRNRKREQNINNSNYLDEDCESSSDDDCESSHAGGEEEEDEDEEDQEEGLLSCRGLRAFSLATTTIINDDDDDSGKAEKASPARSDITIIMDGNESKCSGEGASSLDHVTPPHHTLRWQRSRPKYPKELQTQHQQRQPLPGGGNNISISSSSSSDDDEPDDGIRTTTAGHLTPGETNGECITHGNCPDSGALTSVRGYSSPNFPSAVDDDRRRPFSPTGRWIDFRSEVSQPVSNSFSTPIAKIAPGTRPGHSGTATRTECCGTTPDPTSRLAWAGYVAIDSACSCRTRSLSGIGSECLGSSKSERKNAKTGRTNTATAPPTPPTPPTPPPTTTTTKAGGYSSYRAHVGSCSGGGNSGDGHDAVGAPEGNKSEEGTRTLRRAESSAWIKARPRMDDERRTDGDGMGGASRFGLQKSTTSSPDVRVHAEAGAVAVTIARMGTTAHMKTARQNRKPMGCTKLSTGRAQAEGEEGSRVHAGGGGGDGGGGKGDRGDCGCGDAFASGESPPEGLYARDGNERIAAGLAVDVFPTTSRVDVEDGSARKGYTSTSTPAPTNAEAAHPERPQSDTQIPLGEGGRLLFTFPEPECLLALATQFLEALESVGCACRLCPKPTPEALVRVKACRPVVATRTDGTAAPTAIHTETMTGRRRLLRSAMEKDLPIVGVIVSLSPSETIRTTTTPTITSTVRGWPETVDRCYCEGTTPGTTTTSAGRDGGGGSGGVVGGLKRDDGNGEAGSNNSFTDVVFTLSTGQVSEFDVLVQDLLASEDGRAIFATCPYCHGRGE